MCLSYPTREHSIDKMQASWRLREQKRKEEAEAIARRRAVEKNEISFPSLVQTGWGEANTESTAKAVAAQRWSAGGDIVRSAPKVSEIPQSAGGGGGKLTASQIGVHARISAEVRRATTQSTSWRNYDNDEGEGGAKDDYGCDDDDEWTEVISRTKTRSKLTRNIEQPSFEDDYDDYD